MKASMTVEQIGDWGGFGLKEAVKLINAHVVRKEDLCANPDIELIGYVAGVVTLNDEIEVLIKFSDEMIQLNKLGYTRLLAQLPDD